MALKFIGANGAGSLETAVKAIRYATKMGVRITNNSWGGGGGSDILKDTIQKAGDAGMLFVVAAGNSGANTDVLPEYPASYELENVVSVAALTNRGALANFSNFGKKSVHIAAPGQNILSTIPNNSYASWSGTSMAAPYVAGVAALVLAHEDLSTTKLRTRLLDSAAVLGSLRSRVQSSGMVNAYSALTQVPPRQDPYDPTLWAWAPQKIATPHQYANNFRKEYEIHIPNAKYISAYFSQFKIEENYDRVFFLNKARKVVAMWTGSHSGEFSPVVEGDTMSVRLVTDSYITEDGFDINKAGYLTEGP